MDEVPGISDEELVARTQAGNPDAFDELVVRYSKRLYGLVYDMTSCHEDTNDILQDAFSQAYRSIGEFQRTACFSLWIQSIVSDMTRDFLTKHGSRR